MKNLTYFIFILVSGLLSSDLAFATVEQAPPPRAVEPGSNSGSLQGTSSAVGAAVSTISNAIKGGINVAPMKELASFSLPTTQKANSIIGELFSGLQKKSQDTKIANRGNGIIYESTAAAQMTQSTASQALGGFAQLVKSNSKVSKPDVVTYLQEFRIEGPLLASLDLKNAVESSNINSQLLDELDVKSSDYILAIAVLSFSILDPEQRVPLSWAVARAIRYSNGFYSSLFDRLSDFAKDPKQKQKMVLLMDVLKNQDLIKMRNWVTYLSQHTVIEKDSLNETTEK